MSTWPFVKSEPIRLENHPELGDGWIFDQIAEEPSILGFGELTVRSTGLQQGGCRELICQRPGGDGLYAVVVKTGAADEAQLVRTLEAIARERGTAPVTGVLVAEQVESRYLSIASLVAGCAPMEPVQMQAIRVGGAMTVIFTPLAGSSAAAVSKAAVAETVETPWDEFADESEPMQAEPMLEAPTPAEPPYAPFVPDRMYWQSRDGLCVLMAEQLLSAVQALDPSLELDYHDEYIGLARNGETLDFARFHPEPGAMVVGLRLEQNPLIELGIAQAGLEQVRGENNAGYSLRLRQNEFEAQRGPASRLMRLAFEEARA